MNTGVWVLAIATVAALAFGGWRAVIDGRFRSRGRTPANSDTSPHSEVRNPPLDLAELGARATLLQFSTAFCAPCRATRRILAEVAEVVPGVAHVELDAEAHLDLVRALGIIRTPTTLILDRSGVEVARAAGAPRKEQVLAALAQTPA